MDSKTTDEIKAHYKRQIDFYKKLYDDTSNQLYYERTQNEKLQEKIKVLETAINLSHEKDNGDSIYE